MSNKEVLRLQQKEVERLQQTYAGRGVYCTRRSIVAELSRFYIDQLLDSNANLKILEFGCGDGNALRALLTNHSTLKPHNLSATTLNPLPAHSQLPQEINLRTGVIASTLRQNFSHQFDIVLASAVIQWTDCHDDIISIWNMVKLRGLFIGFDNAPTVGSIENLLRNRSTSILSSGEREVFTISGHGLIPFVLRKKTN